jgi:radical SAM superfamily enzyme YgiQ (UPF0313 family)
MKVFDCILLHPTTHFQISPYEERLRYVIMPMGYVASADLLEREGFGVRIFHTGLERMCNPYFTEEELFRRYEALIVGIDLHWYSHAYDALRLARLVKQVSNAFVVLGGFTASYFAEEILSEFSCVDAVICGEAEVPLLELMKHRINGDLREVPNLLYRDAGSIKRSRRRYVATTQDLDQLDFSNLSLLENWDKYIKLTCENDDLRPKFKTQGWVCIGRGCSVNCSYCGGGKNAYKNLTGRSTPIFRSKKKIVETLRVFEERKISCAYIDFDPYPSRRRFYHELFEMIRHEKIDVSAQFLLWSLSDRQLLQDFKRTFNPLYSTITLSPESGSEYIRKLNKGFYYDNVSLLRWLNYAKDEMIPVELYFTSGLSWETKDHFEETINLGRKIAKDYPMVVSIVCNPIILEPCCPRFISPKEYGISLKFRRFKDFYNTYERFAKGLPIISSLGYETEQLSETEIIQLSQRFNEVVTICDNEVKA